MLHSVCLLDASLRVEEAVRRLQADPHGRFAALRRPHGDRVFWHVFGRAALLDDLSTAPAQVTLESWAGEGGRLPPPAKPLQAARASARRLSSFHGLVLDGDRVLGWQAPRGEDADGVAPSRTRTPRRPADGGRPEDPGVGYFDGRDPESHGAPRSPRWFADGDPAPSPARAADAFHAFPRLVAPAKVSSGEPFVLRVGMADRPVHGVSGGALRVRGLPPGTRQIQLDLQVVAEGFSAPAGWRRTMDVVLAEPEAAEVEIPLVAVDAGGADRLCSLEVHFAHRGTPCGFARRHVVVRGVDPRPGPAGGGEQWAQRNPDLGEVSIPFGEAPPDLTVRISKPDANFATGRLAWSFVSPHLELDGDPVFTDLGTDAQTFARALVRLLGNGGRLGLPAELMEGIGDAIRAQVPDAFWQALRQVWRIVWEGERRPSSVLILSAEAYVPWELALVDPVLDPARPPYLGTQAVMGRWLLDGPPLPPPRTIDVGEFAVVAAKYLRDAGVEPLPSAAAEGRRLRDEHGGILVPLTAGGLRALFAGTPGSDGGDGRVGAIHFACHGTAGVGDPSGDTLVLDDGRILNALAFRRLGVGAWNPFLFLNACQVGQTGELLGTAGGFAGHCLNGGFRGFVAPLWSVRDDVSAELALQFYRRAFGKGGRGVPVAEVLRDLRSAHDPDDEPASLTALAYVFYGHPGLTLRRLPAEAAEARAPGSG